MRADAAAARSDAPPLGVVLAGGASRRMGRPKAGVVVDGRPLIAWPLAALADAGLEAVVVAKAATELPPLVVPRWDEPDAPRHPLCGIVAALERAGGPIVVLACDLPAVPAALVAELARTRAPAVVPSARGALEPLVARYEPRVLAELRAGLAREAPLREVVAALEPLVIPEPALRRYGDPRELFRNVNAPEDLGEPG